jgi:hypothetical protein
MVLYGTKGVDFDFDPERLTWGIVNVSSGQKKRKGPYHDNQRGAVDDEKIWHDRHAKKIGNETGSLSEGCGTMPSGIVVSQRTHL